MACERMKTTWNALVSSLVQPLPLEVDSRTHDLVVEQTAVFVEEQIKQLPPVLSIGAIGFVIFLEVVSLLICGTRFSRAQPAARKSVIGRLSKVRLPAKFFGSVRSLSLFAYFEHSEIKLKIGRGQRGEQADAARSGAAAAVEAHMGTCVATTASLAGIRA